MAAPADAASIANAAAAKSAAPAAQIRKDIGAKTFDYGNEAELYHPRSRTARRRPEGYRRVIAGADDIRVAIEDLPPALLRGAVLEVDEKRCKRHGMGPRYGSAGYPL